VCASILQESKFLRVLVVDIGKVDGRNQHEEARIDLTSISQLFLLIYVKIHARTSTVKLPTEMSWTHSLVNSMRARRKGPQWGD
jgi:hypothetical protein